MKKLLALIVCVTNLLWLCSVYAGASDEVVDSTVDTADIRLYLKSLVLDEATDDIRDVNGDGVMDTLDVRLLLDALTTSTVQEERLLAFKTPTNTSLTHDEIESSRVAQIVNTYEEFETVCATIRPAFYTPYEGKNRSFDTWAQTVSPAYFETKSLFIFTHGTPANDFALAYTVSDDTVDLTIEQSNPNAFGRFSCWQLIVEIDKEDLVDRRLTLQLQ